MTSPKDNNDERFARIEALMEEYRVTHEDLVAYVTSVEGKARMRHLDSQTSLRKARAAFANSQAPKK